MTANPISGLRRALPYLQLYRDKLFVLKVGGEGIQTKQQADQLVEQIALLHSVGIRIVVVHGGGAQADELANRLGIKIEKVNGRRITTSAMLEAMKSALHETARPILLNASRDCGLKAVGVSCGDGGTVLAHRRAPIAIDGKEVDFGEVGDVVRIDTQFLEQLINAGTVPFVSPLCQDEQGNWLNVNADTIAAQLAINLRAEKAIFLTNAPGVLRDVSNPRTLISELTQRQMKELEAQGLLEGGMLPKAKAIADCLENGVPRVHVVSHSIPDSLLIEVFTNEGCGTLITNGEAS